MLHNTAHHVTTGRPVWREHRNKSYNGVVVVCIFKRKLAQMFIKLKIVHLHELQAPAYIHKSNTNSIH